MSRRTINYKTELFKKNLRGSFLGTISSPYSLGGTFYILSPILLPIFAGIKTAIDIIGRWRPREKEEVETYPSEIDKMSKEQIDALVSKIDRRPKRFVFSSTSNSSIILRKLLENARQSKIYNQFYDQTLMERVIIKSYLLNYKNYGKATHELIAKYIQEPIPATLGGNTETTPQQSTSYVKNSYAKEQFIKRTEEQIERLHKKARWWHFNAGCKTKAIHIQDAMNAYKQNSSVENFTAVNEALCEVRIPNQGNDTEAYANVHKFRL